MKKSLQRAEGQVVVQVGVAMLFLLLIVLIAVDVGHAYSERRRMQNAADAGALAGARVLCFGSASGRSAADEALWYAKDENGASATTLADIEVTDWTVTVTAKEKAPTFIAGIIGMSQIDVNAVAKAACGSATTACGLWPVVFDQNLWDDLYRDGAGCDTDFFLWVGDNPQNPDPPDCNTYWCDCYPDNNNNNKCDCQDSNGDGRCDCTDANGDGRCDQSDGDGVNDIFANEGRAYVDLSGALSPEFPDPEGCDNPGCGESELSCWIKNSSGAQISLGACLPDLSGSKTGVKAAVDSRIDDNINVPLFDYMGCTTPISSDCTNGRTFHISGFGCVRPKKYEQNYALPRFDGREPTYKNNMIRVQINCSEECQTSCGSSGGEPPCRYCVRAVSLQP